VFYEEVKFRKLKKVVDGNLSNYALISLEPSEDMSEVNLVIGSNYRNRCASSFSKEDLQSLIEELQVVHSLMKDE
jgi:hypothetical protein